MCCGITQNKRQAQGYSPKNSQQKTNSNYQVAQPQLTDAIIEARRQRELQKKQTQQSIKFFPQNII